MQSTNLTITNLTKKLLDILDDDICNINLALERLNGFREAVIKRDEQQLKTMIELTHAQDDNAERIEQNRLAVKKKLAAAIGCPVEKMNLTRLMEELAEPLRSQVREKQSILKELTAGLKKEHTSTIILLRECATLNRRLLHSMLGIKREKNPQTYNSRGVQSAKIQKRLMSYRV